MRATASAVAGALLRPTGSPSMFPGGTSGKLRADHVHRFRSRHHPHPLRRGQRQHPHVGFLQHGPVREQGLKLLGLAPARHRPQPRSHSPGQNDHMQRTVSAPCSSLRLPAPRSRRPASRSLCTSSIVIPSGVDADQRLRARRSEHHPGAVITNILLAVQPVDLDQLFARPTGFRLVLRLRSALIRSRWSGLMGKSRRSKARSPPIRLADLGQRLQHRLALHRPRLARGQRGEGAVPVRNVPMDAEPPLSSTARMMSVRLDHLRRDVLESDGGLHHLRRRTCARTAVQHGSHIDRPHHPALPPAILQQVIQDVDDGALHVYDTRPAAIIPKRSASPSVASPMSTAGSAVMAELSTRFGPSGSG